MSKADEVPEPWASRMIEMRFVDPRPKHDVASISALAKEADLHASTVSDIIHGRRRPTVQSLQKLIAALGPDVADWFDTAVGQPFTLPDEAALLDERQRRAITELIRSIAAGNAESSRAADGSTADQPRTLRAVASGGADPELAEQASRQAAASKAKQVEAMREMEEKKRRREQQQEGDE